MVVRSFSENPARFQPGATILVGRDPEGAVPMEIAQVRPQPPDRLIVALSGVADRTGAEALRGLSIFVPAGDLPPLPEDAYWEQDLIGLAVVDTAGRPLGEISEVLSRPEQDLWQVETPTGPVLVPAAKGIVVGVDLGAGRVTVDPPAGLFA